MLCSEVHTHTMSKRIAHVMTIVQLSVERTVESCLGKHKMRVVFLLLKLFTIVCCSANGSSKWKKKRNNIRGFVVVAVAFVVLLNILVSPKINEALHLHKLWQSSCIERTVTSESKQNEQHYIYDCGANAIYQMFPFICCRHCQIYLFNGWNCESTSSHPIKVYDTQFLLPNVLFVSLLLGV